MIRGMTGFGRAQGQAAWGAWAWEARSVNGKSIDARVTLPQGFDVLELEAKKRVKDRFQRGNLQLQLRVDMVRAAAETAIDHEELARIVALAQRYRLSAEDDHNGRISDRCCALLTVHLLITEQGQSLRALPVFASGLFVLAGHVQQ